MLHKKTDNECKKNKNIWTINQVRFQRTQSKRVAAPLKVASFEEKCKMLQKIQIVEHYKHFEAKIKDRKERIAQFLKEVVKLWKKLNFFHVSNRVI